MYLGGEEAARATVKTREIHSKSRERRSLTLLEVFFEHCEGGERREFQMLLLLSQTRRKLNPENSPFSLPPLQAVKKQACCKPLSPLRYKTRASLPMLCSKTHRKKKKRKIRSGFVTSPCFQLNLLCALSTIAKFPPPSYLGIYYAVAHTTKSLSSPFISPLLLLVACSQNNRVWEIGSV